MITCTLGAQKYTVDFISGRALREMEPAAKMYSRIVTISNAAVKGDSIPEGEQVEIAEAMDTMIRWFCIAAGFDSSAKSFFSWLCVTYYLSAEAIDTMLSALSGLCAGGSTLVFDYPDESFFNAPEKRVQNTIMMAKAGGEPMQSAFSYGALETPLEKHGFLIYDLLTPDDIQRDVIDRAGADLNAFEHVNYCLAVRKN